MASRIRILLFCLLTALLLNGCALKTVDEMYRIPKRSETESHLQSAIDAAMAGMEYAAPVAGENQQTLQMADLDGDGENEYLLFAKSSSELPLQVLIFDRKDESFELSAKIESNGSVFEQVEYVNIDNRPGLELVIGKRVSDQVLRSLSVYTFLDGEPEQLLSANYQKFLTCNLEPGEASEIMLIKPGEAEDPNGVASLYLFRDGQMTRSREAELSSSADAVKRIMVSSLESGEPAVYVASSLDGNAVITDVFAMKYGKFTNISFSNESGTSVQTMRNYYVYADDVDGDGVLELPNLITMKPLEQTRLANQQYLIRWYAMDIYGREEDKLYTFHNFLEGWYLELDGDWANRVSVVQEGNRYLFYLWDSEFANAELVLTIFSLSGVNREEEASFEGRFLLHRTDSVVYAASLADHVQVTHEDLISAFQLIHVDWKTGET